MLKEEKEYNVKYDQYSNDSDQRYNDMISHMHFNNDKLQLMIDHIKNIKWKTVDFTIYLVPKATPRPRLGHRGVFYVKGASNNKRIFEKYLENRDDIILIKTPVKFFCTTYFPIPSSMNNIEKICAELGLISPISKPDWDNVAKTYCDMIQGSLLLDDSLIIEGSLKKRYSLKPRIEIRLQYMEEYGSKFNEDKILRKVSD